MGEVNVEGSVLGPEICEDGTWFWVGRGGTVGMSLSSLSFLMVHSSAGTWLSKLVQERIT